ncbi:MAG: deoxyribose-phosphate aldolase [Candidatus Krumholzibacteria bacterium]|nr:deoxyribose-phosphate aldolase [Candidatus Krumholzibacteria bacterium]
MDGLKLNRLIDHTLLKPEATEYDIVRLAREAIEYDFYSACVNTHYVPLVARELAGTNVKVCSIAGFPLGAVDAAVKAFEAGRAVAAGAHEIDMVMNVGALKSGALDFTREDIAGVVAACRERAIVKVIIEAALLTDEEKRAACRLAKAAGARFVKTSTGFGPPGASVRDVEIMREAVGPGFGIKASAGIRTAAFALELIEAGATRIGTSASAAIMEEWKRSR